MTFSEFCQKHNITAAVAGTNKNPHMTDLGKDMLNYRVTLHLKNRKMIVPFSTGKGWKREPKESDVLSCLVSDAQTVSSGESLEEWCKNLGYDPDSRKAEKIYRTVQEQTAKLIIFLGGLYEEAIECED